MATTTANNSKSSETFRYRLPSAVGFILAIAGMAIVTDLAFATGPNTSNWERDVVPNMPAHWGTIKAATNGYINLEAFQRACYHLWADRTTGTSVVTYWIAIGAWIAHAIETIFAVRKCIAYGASAGVTLCYGIGVFLSGIGQFGNLNAEARRVDRVKKGGKKSQ